MTEKKKINLAEAMKQKLAQKQQAQAQGKFGKNSPVKPQTLKSQLSKKPSNTRRKMGS
ncbi:hypothetical protein JOD43_000978 [Pullulanibacillus pueri]|uniref:Uncharacterized protein n=1 Tax=Pullulanibacillus pueri TaxID=1437324 RepID=A0A8J2ZV17_9BACL|nr:hypothetical protein [Pullulanibacillus pueri]MBM7680814.1 hypothetical protein [Pullulanibacillus pueri]GGH78439.1 hypothetical protein GCM10007096_11860 [Pullulanibacillus pueri]